MNLKFSKHNEVHILTALGEISSHDIKVLKIGCSRLFEDNPHALVVLDLSFAVSEVAEHEIKTLVQELNSSANACDVTFTSTSEIIPTVENAIFWVQMETLKKKSEKLKEEMAFRGDIKETISKLRQENSVLLQELIESQETNKISRSKSDRPAWLSKILKITGLEDSNGSN